jgi:hypothetical protein
VGFFLTPTVRRTLAPRGQRPVLDAWDRRDRWSAISCVTLSPVAGRPGLYFDLLDHNVHGGTWSPSWPTCTGGWGR